MKRGKVKKTKKSSDSIVINRIDVLNKLDIVRDGLVKLDWMDYSDHFIFANGHVMTFNDELFLQAELKDIGFHIGVPGNQFYSLLSKLSTKSVKLKLQENTLLIRTGKSKAGLACVTEPSVPIPELKSDVDWKKLPSNFLQAIDFVDDSCAKETSVPILTCIHVTPDYCETSDRFRISRARFDEQLELSNFLLPVKNVKSILKIEPTEAYLSGEWIHFRNADGVIISSRIFEGEFLDLDKYIVMDGSEIEFPIALSKSLERAYVFAKRDHFLDEEVELVVDKDRILIRAQSDAGIGWFEEELNFENKRIKDTIKFHISPSILSAIFENTSDENVIAEVSSSFIKFEKQNLLYMGVLKQEEENE